MSRRDKNKDLPRLSEDSSPVYAASAPKKRRVHPSVWGVIGGLCVLVASASAVFFGLKQFMQPESTPQQAVVTTQVPTLTFAAMGDMLAHDSIVAQATTDSGYDFAPYFQYIRPLYSNADVVFCNPETPVAGETLGVSGYPTFNAPSEFARDMHRSAGCNLINLATNHMSDKGQQGINDSLDVWSKQDVLAYSGANRSQQEQDTVKYFEKNGIKVAFLAFADFSNAAPPSEFSLNVYHKEALVRRLVTEARDNADAVVVSAHWGTEDSTTVNDDQKQFASLLAGLGVDVIIGTGPHVLQSVEWVDGSDGHRTLTWYSIGNMLSSQLLIDELTGGVAGFQITKSENGIQVTSPTFKATYMSYDWPAADRAEERLETRTNLQLRPLSNASDSISTMFPDSSLQERTTFVRTTLGESTGVSITP